MEKLTHRTQFFGNFLFDVDLEMGLRGCQHMLNHDILGIFLWSINDIYPNIANVQIYISPQKKVFPHIAQQDETIMFDSIYDLRKYESPEEFFIERDMNGDILSKDEKTLLGYFIWLRQHTQELEEKHNAK